MRPLCFHPVDGNFTQGWGCERLGLTIANIIALIVDVFLGCGCGKDRGGGLKFYLKIPTFCSCGKRYCEQFF